jgi:hypothetical protein
MSTSTSATQKIPPGTARIHSPSPAASTVNTAASGIATSATRRR